MTKVAVIGSGFSGLAAATLLASKGIEVDVFEKNSTIGGRARQFSSDGFVFDMGPSWYWMPDVFENYFNQFQKSPSDYYSLVKLSPSFRIYFGKNNILDIPDTEEELYDLFERIEKGSAKKLQKFLKEAKYKYEVGIRDLVYKPGLSITEYFDSRVLKGIFRLQLFSSFSKHVRSYFKDERLISLMEFPVLFLGAQPQNTPALYSLMNYAGLSLGTWYPMGGFFKVVEGMKNLAIEKGVTFHTNASVEGFNIEDKKILHVYSNKTTKEVDAIVASADYAHIDQQLLGPSHQTYHSNYWNSRTFAPSALIFFLGVNKRVSNLKHHNLFFDEDFELHAKEIYQEPQWPTKPLFYVCCPSKTDPSVAPADMENLFILMPLAPGIEDNEEFRNKYFKHILYRIEKITGESISDSIVFKKDYCINNFISDYNAYKGNAYGLANTLRQTAILKPSIRSKKIINLYYSGQLTVPGPGVPPSLISGQVTAMELLKNFKLN
jgi:phytoene desaturase